MKFIPGNFYKESSAITLLLANAYPILGAIFLGWNVFEIVILYCIETFIIGLYNIAKMIKVPAGKNGTIQKFFFIPFFLVHYNAFVFAQTFFVFIFFTEIIKDKGDLPLTQIALGIVILFCSHGYSFYKNYIKKEEYKNAELGKLMFQPYGRIIIQQITVIVGGMFIMMMKSPLPLLIILVALKTIFDLVAHFKGHNSLVVGRNS